MIKCQAENLGHALNRMLEFNGNEGGWSLRGGGGFQENRKPGKEEEIMNRKVWARSSHQLVGGAGTIILVNCYFSSLLLFAVVFTIFRRDQDRRQTHLAVASELVAEHGEAPQAGWKWLERKKG